MTTSAPIGVFDSGIGGLTVAHAITQRLPNEHLIYFGDTAHLPYGDKSEAAIQAYSVKIADVLLRKGCKAIVIACNSASSAAYELLREYVRRDAGIINVIDPMVDLVVENYPGKRVGLIGTKRTIQSGVYHRKMAEAGKGIELRALATPLLVPMIEEGFVHNRISGEILDAYLGDAALEGIEALILGCTHYPLIRKDIEASSGAGFAILDSSEVVAEALYRYLSGRGLLNTDPNPPRHQFLVSDYTDSFESSTRLFFQKEVHLEKHPLWAGS